MGIAQLKKDGWFDLSKRTDIHLSVSEEQIDRIRNKESVIVRQDKALYLVYLREGVDLKSVQEDDLIIR
jgi:hypothetical protein